MCHGFEVTCKMGSASDS